MHRKLIAILVFFLPLIVLFASSDIDENKRVAKITIVVENLPANASFNQDHVLSKLSVKIGDPFSHLTFDQDLKTLSQEYDRVEPTLEMRQGELFITIKLWRRPIIRAITYNGNAHIKTSTLRKELGIAAHTVFNREEFNQAFNKLKEYYLKKGYFDSQLEYRLVPHPNTNGVDINIIIQEGQSGYINNIHFSGLSRADERMILKMLNTKRYNFFMSWITEAGTYHEEVLEHDKLLIGNYLQNLGYANAQTHIQIEQNQEGKLEVYIHVVKGEVFHFGTIDILGNNLLTVDQIRKVMIIEEGSVFSPEKLRDSIENIKKLYGKDGYIEANIHYALSPESNSPVYHITITISEGEQFHIGMIHILGNSSTNKNVILRESLLVPGEVFDLRRLEATQKRLEGMGYFKSVNVYATKTPEDQRLGENYRDVIIEVEESTTGSLSLFLGFSSVEDIFGGIDIGENNFSCLGLTNFWRTGLSSLRGAGEYAHARLQIGKKQRYYTMSWMNPYLRDSLWRFGVEFNYATVQLQSNNYNIHSIGGALFGSYPLTSYWTYGWKWRLQDSNVHILPGKIESVEAKRERDNSGLVGGLGNSLTFDSTDNAFKPHRGFHSSLEMEVGTVHRHASKEKTFPYCRFAYLNKYYYPLYSRGTIKVTWDFKFLCPLGRGRPNLIPLSERFFLGGESSVRGYKTYILGPKFADETGRQREDTPMGGVSSALLSIEYRQHVLPMLDLFVFFDGGSISMKTLEIAQLRMSYGIGTQIELASRVPVILGFGFPINPKSKHDVSRFFIAMGGQF